MNPALQLRGGKLLLNRCGGDKLVAFVPSLNDTEDEEPCCCNCCKFLTCSATEFGVSSGYGWDLPRDILGNVDVNKIPRNLPITIRFIYPDSSNCNGISGVASGGNLRGCFEVSSNTQIRISVSGLVEQENSGFDFGEISLDSGLRTQIGSFNRGLGCQMIENSNNATGDIAGGYATYLLAANTVDGLFHVGMTHTFTIEQV